MNACARCGVSDVSLSETYHNRELGGAYCFCCQIIIYNRKYERQPAVDDDTEQALIRMQRAAHRHDQQRRLSRAGLHIPPGAMSAAAHSQPQD